MTTMTIRLTFEVPTGAELVDVQTDIAKGEGVDDVTPVAHHDGVRSRIASAPEPYHAVLGTFASRLADELSCTVEVPTGQRVDYLNVYPPSGRRARVASFMVRESTQLRGPRVEIYCDPANANDHPPAEPDLHNGRAVQVKVYLGDTEALDAAVALVAIAVKERS